MKNWKYGANPKKVNSARRRAQPGWRKATAAVGIGYAPDEKKPFNNPKRVVIGRYEDRQPETVPSPGADVSPNPSPEGEKADSAR